MKIVNSQQQDTTHHQRITIHIANLGYPAAACGQSSLADDVVVIDVQIVGLAERYINRVSLPYKHDPQTRLEVANTNPRTTTIMSSIAEIAERRTQDLDSITYSDGVVARCAK